MCSDPILRLHHATVVCFCGVVFEQSFSASPQPRLQATPHVVLCHLVTCQETGQSDVWREARGVRRKGKRECVRKMGRTEKIKKESTLICDWNTN